MKAFKNVKIITKNGMLYNKALIYNEKIVDIIDENTLKNDIEAIDCGGSYLSPGFINLHIHGLCGYDTMDDNDTAILEISKNIVKTGVTSFLPTTMTVDFSDIEKALKRIRKAKNYSDYANILGCHMEGPFINEKYKGAQDRNYILKPDFKKISQYKDVIKIVTIAPEIEGSIEFIKSCCENEIIVSIGHSNGTFDEASNAIDAGAKHITHTFNAMSPLNHRNPGVVGAAMLKDVTCELICDNFHIHPSIQKLIYKIKGNDGIILVTDSMRACLLKDGQYELGGNTVYVRGTKARLIDGTIAGSLLTMNNGIKNFIDNTGISIWEAVNMASLNPAKLIHVNDKKGSIEPGKDADLVLLDDGFKIISTYVRGLQVYKGE